MHEPDTEVTSLEWYRSKMEEVELDLENARFKENYSAVANLHTKIQGYREKYDQLMSETAIRHQQELQAMSDDALISQLQQVLSDMPDDIRIRILDPFI